MVSFYMMRQNTQDEYCIKEVLEGNEYRLPERFPPNSTVIDLGANMGCFALAALSRGAAIVDCYEPEWENFRLLQHNVKQANRDPSLTGKVLLNQEAVWSDRGRSGVFDQGSNFTAMYTTAPLPDDDKGAFVPQITMADILAKHTSPEGEGEIELVKIDVEGAEVPILQGWYEATGADHRVKAICGEVHYALKPNGWYSPTRDWLYSKLNKLGFGSIEIVNNARSPLVANFWATKGHDWCDKAGCQYCIARHDFLEDIGVK